VAGADDLLAVSLDVGLHPSGAPQWGAAVPLTLRTLELLGDAAPGTVLSLNVPDRPVECHRELREARLAEFGTVQARVDDFDDGHLRLDEVEVGDEPEEGTDSALLAAGQPTVTALRSVGEDADWSLPATD